MKKKIAALLLLVGLMLPVGIGAQEPLIQKSEGFTAPGTGVSRSLASAFPSFHRFSWGPTTSPLTACTVEMEKSIDGVTWESLVPAQDCTIPSSAKVIANTRFVRSQVTALAGGTLAVLYRGFDGDGCGMQYNGIRAPFVGSDPAPGTEIVITVPEDERWKIGSVRFNLITDSSQGDRSVFFSIDDGSVEYVRTFADGRVEPNQTATFTALALGFVGTTGVGPASIQLPADERTILVPIHANSFLPGGYRILTDTDGLQLGDDYSAPALLLERCPN